MCEVCMDKGWKYKCPHCCIKYCSVDCYKVHKCEKTFTDKPQKERFLCKERPLELDSDDDTELLRIEQLLQLNCITIKEFLSKS